MTSQATSQVQTPSIGRIVHFKDNGGHVMPGIITKVWSDVCVNLTVFPDPSDSPSPVEKPTSVTYDAGLDQPYRWCWPPRV